MSKKKRLIIPVFIPFGGCPNKCVFCDQRGITGEEGAPSCEEVRKTIDAYLSTWKGSGPREIAFYGGSFTALDKEIQTGYLEAARPYLSSGRVDSIRVSTRPDCIDETTLKVLEDYGVSTVELGVQSMSDEVLRLSGRGHTAAHTVAAALLLKKGGFAFGAQFMPGLPGDTEESVLSTARDILALRPDFARIYPTMVLRNTPLFKMYESGAYAPWGLERMIDVCARIALLFKEAGVPIIRMGLQPTDSLLRDFIAGPFHPSFRDEVARAMTV